MNFRKRNYQRGQVKRHHQQQLNALIGNKTEAEIKEVYELFLNYEATYKQATDRFENFIRSKLTKSFFGEVRRSNIEKTIQRRESDMETAAQKMRAMNISFERKSFLSRIIFTETEQEELLRNQYSGAISHLKELRTLLLQGNEVFDTWCTFGVEQYFLTRFSNELEEQLKVIAKIGVTIEYKDEDLSFGLDTDQVTSFISSNKENDFLNLKLNYSQKYYFFASDKIAVRDYFSQKFSKINKRKEERNLRALAAEKTDKQRSLASNNRTKKEYENQFSIVACCPYCGGDLGNFSGKNAAHFEHIHPVSKGGLSTIENTVFICANCNTNKTNMTLNAFIMKFSMDRDAIFERLHLLGKDF